MFCLSRAVPRPYNGGRRVHVVVMSLFVFVLGILVTNRGYGQLSMLHASGLNVVDNSGQVVPLRGVNLGGWFIMEKWMSPLTSDSEPDTYTVMQTLDNRFRVSNEQS